MKIKKNLNIIFTIIFFVAGILFFMFYNKVENFKNLNKCNINISVASSMQDVFLDIKKEYEKSNKNINITLNPGSSGSLLRQIEQGSETDIFISASNKQINKLKKENLTIDNSEEIIAKNKIILIASKDNLEVKDWKSLLLPTIESVAIGEVDTVPIGTYAKEVLGHFKIFNRIKNKIVYSKNSKEIILWVETYNSDSGIVYLSDVRKSNNIRIVKEAPEKSYKKVEYIAIIIKRSKYSKESKDFLEFIKTKKIQQIFKDYGFIAIK